jgi:hypothetical protein
VQSHVAQGWYRDPYHVHEDRYFSAGRATKLVRDDGQERYDEPPDQPYIAADLVAVPEQEGDLTGRDLLRADQAERRGTGDMRRADDAGLDPPYSADEAKRRAFDQFDQMMPAN